MDLNESNIIEKQEEKFDPMTGEKIIITKIKKAAKIVIIDFIIIFLINILRYITYSLSIPYMYPLILAAGSNRLKTALGITFNICRRIFINFHLYGCFVSFPTVLKILE